MPKTPPIERAFFREAEDGATVFFPWGLTHRGYRLDGPEARKKASRATSLLLGSVIAIGTWTAHALQPLLQHEAHAREVLERLAAPGAALVLVLFAYTLWASRFVERFPESDLQVSRDERLREAAALAEPRKVTVVGVVLGGLGALLIRLQPHAWWLGVLAIALGAGMLLWSSVLRRAAAAPSAPGPGGGEASGRRGAG